MFKKILLILSGLSGLILFTACGSGKDINVESVLPEDSTFVFVLDYSDSDQVDKFENLLEKFPKTDFIDKLLETYQAYEGNENNFSYEKDIKPILDSEWKMAFALNINENVDSFEGVDNLKVEDMEIYFAGQFSEADKIQKLIETHGEGLTYEKKDDADYWTNVAAELYLGVYGDVVFVTNTDTNRETALERLKNDGGITKNTELKSEIGALSESNMGYVFLDFDRFGSILKELYVLAGYGSAANYFAAMGDMYGVWEVYDDGVKLISSVKITDESSMLVADSDYEISLEKNVPAEGVFLYAEQSGLGVYFGAFLDGFMAGFNGVNNSEVGIEDSTKIYQDFLKSLADTIDVSEEEVVNLWGSPFAFVMSDVNTYYPTVALYLKVDENELDSAKKLTNALDGYVDTMVVKFDELLASEASEVVGVLKRDVALVGGAGLHKIYLDWNALPPELLAQFSLVPGFDVTKMPLELYYGVTGDNVLTIAFYPDFAAAYNGDVLINDNTYSEAKGKIGEDSGYAISYFALSPLISIFDKYVDIGTNLGVISSEDLEKYNLYAKQFFGTFKYIISSSKLEGGNLRSYGFMKIEEVELEDAQ